MAALSGQVLMGRYFWTGISGPVFLERSFGTGLFGIGAANPIDPTC